MQKVALVTGGTGFLGDKLVGELLKKNYTIRVVARNEGKLILLMGESFFFNFLSLLKSIEGKESTSVVLFFFLNFLLRSLISLFPANCNEKLIFLFFRKPIELFKYLTLLFKYLLGLDIFFFQFLFLMKTSTFIISFLLIGFNNF